MRIALILSVYFLLGGAATAVAASRADAGKRRSYWVKYFVYLVLTAALVALIACQPAALPYLVALLGLAGYWELARAQQAFAKTHPATAPGWFVRGAAGDNRTPFVLPAALYFLCATLLFLLSTRAGDTPVFLHTYVVVVAFDGFSQITGQLVRSPRLMPRVSPGKTVAGLAGGLLAAAATGALLEQPHPAYGALFGAGTGIAAFTGDALASLYKRRLGIKDYSQLIPGHGGILDRFDSLLLAGAAAEVVFYMLPTL